MRTAPPCTDERTPFWAVDHGNLGTAFHGYSNTVLYKGRARLLSLLYTGTHSAAAISCMNGVDALALGSRAGGGHLCVESHRRGVDTCSVHDYDARAGTYEQSRNQRDIRKGVFKIRIESTRISAW